MKRLLTITLAALAIASCATNTSTPPTAWVDPLIGAGGHGHVFVGANVPHGMVQLGPTQPTRGWDWCSGYHYSDTIVLGFSHTRLSGTGIGELGDVLLMPYDPATPVMIEERGRVYAGLDHSLETVRPGYYSLDMPDYGVRAELTATERVGLHRYTFSSRQAGLVVDLLNGVGWDRATDTGFTVIDSTHVTGWRRSTGWAKDHIYYFAAEFSSPFTEAALPDGVGKLKVMDRHPQGPRPKGFPPKLPENSLHNLTFNLGEDNVLEVKVALSPVSEENAVKNLGETPSWDFDATAQTATRKWDEELSRIEIDPLNDTVGRIFYTALYHFSFAPYIFSDPDGSYRGADGQIHQSDTPIYTVFSLWDTYRAAMPLMTVIDPELAAATGQTFLKIYHEQGKLPVWHLCGNETDCMVGNPGVIVTGDLVLKGLIPESQREEAYEAMVTSAMLDERGQELIKKYGFIPFDKSAEPETVAKGMEFAIADEAVSRVAKLMDDGQNELYFAKRGRAYSKYFDTKTNFVRGRASDGSWRKEFDPIRPVDGKSDFTEGNAWQYTWLAPHDVRKLTELFGTEEAFIGKLDSLFVVEGDMGPGFSDVTGLIGQYAHGNEPSHHIAYLYSYVGRQWRTAELVRKILGELYRDDPDGLCGNEDVGQMSAWYILSALGLYQVDPIGGDFLIGSPVVRSATIRLPEGRTFRIVAKDNSDENIYVQSARLNGKPLDRSHISYAEIMAGGTLELQMGPERSRFGAPEL
ncbi:MAG: GH92 family glycosyl hydrolase, partial [Bacteroidales bacterium]|nr:GH92 family glycosyl hydrolase [Bacteroidales bacterium]